MASCFWDTGNKIQNFNSTLVPCGNPSNSNVESCCTAGDICMSSGICHYTEPSVGGSGFYLAGCTDPNFKDPACVQACSDLSFMDVVYSSSLGLWQCCGGQHACNAPISNATFPAPAPADLQAIGRIDASAGTSTSTNPATTASTSPTPAPSTSIHLSMWTEVGIVIAATALFLILVSLAAWRIVICRRRRKARIVAPMLNYNPYYGYNQAYSQRSPSEVSELPESRGSIQKAWIGPPREMEA